MKIINKPFVSIIMNCFNGEPFLKEAIESVYAQTYEHWEIILWDNGSTDNSSQIKNLFDEKLKYFYSENNVPLYEARNLALDVCHGDVVAFLDCDDIWIVNKLEKQIAKYQSGANIVYGAFELINQSGKKIHRNIPKIRTGKITSHLLIKNMVSIGSILIDKKIIEKNKFDPKFNLLGDFELWLRLSLLEDFFCVDGTVELSRHHDKNISKTDWKNWILEERYLYKKLLKDNYISTSPALLFFIIKCELKNLISIIINKNIKFIL